MILVTGGAGQGKLSWALAHGLIDETFEQYAPLDAESVNAVLAVSVLAAGLWSGITVALLSPLFAFLLGIGPQLPPIVPSIAVGNLVFVLLLGLLAGGGEPPLWKRAAAWLLAAAAKFGVLYLLVVKLLCVVLPLQEPQAAAFSTMFSYPQLITALAGGAAGLFLSPLLRRASRRSPARD